MAKFLPQLKNEHSNERLELLASMMFHHFGGMQGFVAAWASYHKRAIEEGGFAGVRCFQ